MIIAGIVLIASGILAATYHYVPLEFSSTGKPPTLTYVYPYTSVGLILGILGLVMLIIGILLLVVKPRKE